MLKLTILSRDGAVAVLALPNDFTHLISIGDAVGSTPLPEVLVSSIPYQLRLEFDDISVRSSWVERWGYIYPSLADVLKILDFSDTTSTDGHLLVHCEQGISRSTAAAIIFVLRRLGLGSEEEAIKKVFEARQIASPNSLMIKLADDYLGYKGALVEAVRKAKPNRSW